MRITGGQQVNGEVVTRPTTGINNDLSIIDNDKQVLRGS